MRKSVQCAAVLALFAATGLFAASEMVFTLELGGDNHAASWEQGNNDAYTRTVLANGGEGQTFDLVVDPNAVANWSVIVEVRGLHADPGQLGDNLLPSGAANMVFDLELTKDGNLVQVGHATMAGDPAVPTTAGFFSSINDGDCEDARCVIEGQASPELNAAYAVAFDVDLSATANGRVFDAISSDGPFVDFYHYPSAAGLPAASTAPLGKLIGMGAGYKEFLHPNLGGPNMPGVGIASDASNGDCEKMGVLPVFEGQISLKLLPAGTYTLALKASTTGNNVLIGDSASYMMCWGAPSRFAIKVNSVVEDSITFVVAGEDEPKPAPVLASAVSRKNHVAADFDIDVKAAGAVECRDGGPTTVELTFDVDVQVSGAITASSGTVGGAVAVGNKVTVSLSGVADAAPVTLGLAGISNAADAAKTCADSVCFGVLKGDANADMLVDLFDLLAVRNVLNQSATAANFTKDINFDNVMDLFDLLAIRNNLNKTVAACP